MSGEKAVVTCQKYQFSENKKIGLFQPKARLDTRYPSARGAQARTRRDPRVSRRGLGEYPCRKHTAPSDVSACGSKENVSFDPSGDHAGASTETGSFTRAEGSAS
jgi:hypothetical protein